MKTNTEKKEYIKHIWTVLCQNSSTDGPTNSLSLFNILEEATISLIDGFEKQIDKEGFSAIPAQFQLVSLWSRSDLDKKELIIGDVKIILKDPDGNPTQDFTYTLTIPSDKKRMRFTVNLTGIKINLNKSGNYIFDINLRGPKETDFHQVTQIPLYLIINKPGK